MNLAECIELAAKAHRNQVDRGAKPYILHCLRVMMKMTNESDMKVAVLHDVAEDAPDGMEFDFKSLTKEEQTSLYALTKPKDALYSYYIDGIFNNEQARRVKIADLQDNIDLTRLPHITINDLARVEKYHKALRMLTGGSRLEVFDV